MTSYVDDSRRPGTCAECGRAWMDHLYDRCPSMSALSPSSRRALELLKLTAIYRASMYDAGGILLAHAEGDERESGVIALAMYESPIAIMQTGPETANVVLLQDVAHLLPDHIKAHLSGSS